MFLKGIRIYNYRSIDEKGVELDDFEKVNIFIGKNNSGKSNIIRFIAYIKQFTDKDFPGISQIVSKEDNFFNFDYTKRFHFATKLNEDTIYNYLDTVPDENFQNQFINTDQMVWIEYTPDENNFLTKHHVLHEEQLLRDSLLKKEPLAANNIQNLFDAQLSSFVLNQILNTTSFFIENYRRIVNNPRPDSFDKSAEQRSFIFNGNNFVARLKDFALPNAGRKYVENKKIFKKFIAFVKDILNNDEIDIEISKDDLIQVRFRKDDSSVKPLENVGTGIHQIILLAFATISNENCIFCIEEPEIFIHPEVQRKFIRYLIENTNNQYFITTHSNAFINEEGLDVYRVWHNGHSTQVEKTIDSSSKNQILDDLGYKASDLLQTNFIIWVEGPSDRIYIRHWIGLTDKKLIEGIHYTIMFYGGRLLSHLSAHDEEINEFIDINKINRNASIFIDSDKKDDADTINDTKTRIIAEFGEKKFCLLTAGREIENYIDLETLNASLKAMGKEEILECNLFTDIFKIQELNKMKLAKEIVSRQTAVPTLGELNQQITELVGRIKKANE